jgi:hypothetical protein
LCVRCFTFAVSFCVCFWGAGDIVARSWMWQSPPLLLYQKPPSLEPCGENTATRAGHKLNAIGVAETEPTPTQRQLSTIARSKAAIPLTANSGR